MTLLLELMKAADAKQGREAYDRLKKAGAHKEHGREMKDLWNAIHAADSAEHAIDSGRKVNGGSDTKVGYARKLMYQRIEQLEDMIKASTGAGGTHKDTRARWAEKQKNDPTAQKVRSARDALNRD